jgi:hypothetical protein
MNCRKRAFVSGCFSIQFLLLRFDMAAADFSFLRLFETPRPFVEASLSALRLGNTALDSLFYDVGVLWTELLFRGTAVVTTLPSTPLATKAFGTLDLGALTNPEGSILIVDAGRAPFVLRYDDVQHFLEFANGPDGDVQAVSITGVGSSALGSVAFAWNLSVALGEPVAAIVPGYGVADVVQQALGGWYGFGLTAWIKKGTQDLLAHLAPDTAQIGRHLMMTAEHQQVETGAPVFERGSGSSDVLHTILKGSDKIRLLFGHSKGALAIGNAIHGLPETTTNRLLVTTLGCPIQEDAAGAKYLQFLGVVDGLGQLNSWGNQPEVWLYAHHSTNTTVPLSMLVSLLARLTEFRAEAASTTEPGVLADPAPLPGIETIGIGRSEAPLTN